MSAAPTPFGVRKFRRLLFASSFAFVAQFLMTFLASAIAGNLLGSDALSGVSLLAPISTALSFVAALLGVGMAVCALRAQGEGSPQRANELFSQGLWSVLIFGVVSSLVLFFGSSALIDFFGPSAPVRAMALAYCRVFVFVPFVHLLAVYLINVCYADGDDVLCYAAYGVELLGSVGVSFAAIRGGMGTAGCALGTVAGYLLAIGVLAAHFFRRSNSFRLVRHFDGRETVRMMRTVFGDSSSFLFQAIEIFFFEKYVLHNWGSELLPAVVAVFAALGLLDAFAGVPSAVQPIASVYLGERNTRAVREILRDALRICLAEGVVATIVFFACPRLILAAVGISEATLVTVSSQAIRFVAIGFVALAVINLLNGYYVIINRGGLSTCLAAANWSFAPIALVLILGGCGLSGVWLSLGLASVLTLACCFAYEARHDGARQIPFLLPREREAKIFIWTLPLEPEAIVDTAGAVADRLAAEGAGMTAQMRVRLIVEETLMVVREHNGAKAVLGEVTLDLNEGVRLTLRDDGEIFDLTDADARISSLRTFLLCSVMERQQKKENLLLTGFNRNIFWFDPS